MIQMKKNTSRTSSSIRLSIMSLNRRTDRYETLISYLKVRIDLLNSLLLVATCRPSSSEHIGPAKQIPVLGCIYIWLD